MSDFDNVVQRVVELERDYLEMKNKLNRLHSSILDTLNLVKMIPEILGEKDV